MTEQHDLLALDDAPEDSLSRVFVDTRQTLGVFRALDRLLAEPRTGNHAYAAALLGPPRCGKTSLLREYLALCRDGVQDDPPDGGKPAWRRRELRCLYVELQPGTRLNSLPRQILDAMGDPAPSYGTTDRKTARVTHTLALGSYDLVVLDEIHNLVDSDTQQVEHKAVHWISGLLNAGRTPIVLAGYDAFADVIVRNAALGGRMRPMPRLRPLRWDNPDDLADFACALDEIERHLGLPTASGLSAPDIGVRLCAGTEGRFGWLELLLSEARAIARAKRHSCILRQTLRDAVEASATTWYRLPFNVFDVADIAAEMSAFEDRGGRATLAPSGPRRRRRKADAP